MAREISDFDGTTLPVDAINLYGALKDAPLGTIVNSKSNNDMQVFFQRMMAMADITPNGLADNATNGFQLWLAFEGNPVNGFTVISGLSSGISVNAAAIATHTGQISTLNTQVALSAWVSASITGTQWAANTGSVVPRYRKDGMGRVYMNGEAITTGSSAGQTIFTLPSGFRPTQTMIVMCASYNGSTYVSIPVSILTTGDVQIALPALIPGATSNTIDFSAIPPFLNS